MNTRGIIGKKIVRIDQRRFFNDNTGRMDIDVERIVLENGTIIWPVVIETESEYAVDFDVIRNRTDVSDHELQHRAT